MTGAPRTEARLLEIAGRQHGVITRAQLLETGVTDRMILRRVAQQRLVRLHRGVYLMGPLLSVRTQEMAAALACGPCAVVSHSSAAVIWGLLRRPAASAPVHVTVMGGDRGHRQGILSHRVARFDAAARTHVDGVPVTTPARTLLDLAAELCATARLRELEQAVAQAERRGLVSRAALYSVVARHPRSRGVGQLRQLLQRRTGPAWTRSEAESRFLEVVRSGGLPEPEVNVDAAGYQVDFLWPGARLIVEVDGYAYHGSAASFEADRRRDADLTAAGYRVVRVTWRQLTVEPNLVLARIAMLLGPGFGR